MRHAAVAGQFYPGTREELVKLIEACYRGPLGPGELPRLGKGPRSIKGLVVPHAGYVYSGQVAAHSYLELAKDSFPDSFIILGPNHTGEGNPLALTTHDFETPLGIARADRGLANELARGMIFDDPNAHLSEHSIEVQLPFLQHIKPDIKFVPVCMGMQDYESAREVGEAIAQAIRGKSVVVIASTDFSHYIPMEHAYKTDRLVLDRILALDPKGVGKVVDKEHVSMCGYGPVMAMLTAAKLGGAKQVKLLKYATSGDVHRMSEVVGYGALVIR